MSARIKKTNPVKKAPVKKKTAKGYELPDPIRSGEILKDLLKKEWQIGPSIGVGGFGEIYSATNVMDTPKKKASYPYVVKVEPHINGPLFVEMHFYIKAAKSAEIEEWMKTKKLKSLGMPRYLGSGSHEYNGKKYRFLVIDRYGKNLWSLFLENKRVFPFTTVMRIALQIIDVLEYIHSKSYVHADIKGGNLLLGLHKGTENQVYLVDFGLATRYTEDFKPDPKQAHNGTLWYTSRDAHVGVPSMRGDLEILAYNMLQWLASKLPWEDLSDPVIVQQKKTESMNDIPGFMKKSFPKSSAPAALVKYFEYVGNLKHSVKPDYAHCRKLFEKGLKDCKCPVEGKLDFTSRGPVQKQTKTNSEGDEEDSTENDLPVKRRKNQVKVPKKKVDSDSSDSDYNEDQSYNSGEKKRTRRKTQTKVPKENGNHLSHGSDEDSDVGQQIKKKQVRRRNQPKVSKETVKNLRSGSEDDNDKKQQVDKSKFFYRAGEYKRLPPELRPYKLKKPKNSDS